VPNAFATAFITVLILLEPLSNVPTFLSLTERRANERARIALVAVVAAAIVLGLFAVIGESLLAYLKISIEDLQVAGGIVLMVVALQLMAGKEPTADPDDTNVAVVPLAIPFLAGPGTIVALLVLLDEYKATSDRIQILGAVALALLIIYVCFRFASVIAKKIRPSLSRAITRVVGLLVMAIAVHFIASAIGEWFHNGVS
jgi:multiple antibiotic resistance protein